MFYSDRPVHITCPPTLEEGGEDCLPSHCVKDLPVPLGAGCLPVWPVPTPYPHPAYPHHLPRPLFITCPWFPFPLPPGHSYLILPPPSVPCLWMITQEGKTGRADILGRPLCAKPATFSVWEEQGGRTTQTVPFYWRTGKGLLPPPPPITCCLCVGC